MKKNLLAISSILLMFTLLISCKKENNNNANKKSLTKQSMTIGVIHNDALEYCYDFLQTQNDLHELTQEEKMSIIKEKTIEYLVDNNPYGLNQSTIEQFCSNSPFTISSGITYFNTDQNQRISNLLSNYSGTKQELIENVFEAIDNSDNLIELQNELNVISQQITSLSQQDQDEINSYISVAENSWNYWFEDDGIDNWINILVNQSNMRTSRPDIAKEVIKGDIEGAINGALAGAGFAGVGALAGAMIGAPLWSGWSALWAI